MVNGKTRKNPVNPVNPEEMVNKLKRTISSLSTNLAIYDNDMKRELENLRTQYGINSIEEGIKRVEELDGILEVKNRELEEISQKISVAMRSYDNG